MISGAFERSKLAETAHLDQMIATEMITQMKKSLASGRKVIIEGIRQESIFDAILEECESIHLSIQPIWLQVPSEILKERFYSRADRKDDVSFERARAKDAELGLYKLEHVFKMLPNVLIKLNS
jgi:predicted kinase